VCSYCRKSQPCLHRPRHPVPGSLNAPAWAALARCVKTGERSPDDPDLIEARRNLCALKLEEHMRLALAATPSMTDEQIKHLIALLSTRGGRQ
jgi:hypothetical protein